jgi:hypothetical protein
MRKPMANTTRLLSFAWVILAMGCAGSLQIEDRGLQVFDDPDHPLVHSSDSLIGNALSLSAANAKERGYRIDGRYADSGYMEIEARWKGLPISIDLLFERTQGELTLSSACSNGGNFMDASEIKTMYKACEVIQKEYFQSLKSRTDAYGLKIVSSPYPLRLMAIKESIRARKK